MASLTCTPTSLQLRLAFAAPKFPHPPHVRMRNFKLNRLRPLRAAQDGVSSEWAGPGPKLDGFSGWSDTDAEQRPNNAPKKDSYGGVVGVGVAGVLLLSGLTFAALSLGKQTGSRPEQHMKTLTTQQEELLSSDDHNDEITEQGNVDSMVEQGNGKMEVKSKSPNSGSFFSVPGIPAPSVVSASVQVLPGKVLVPAAVDQVQGQALAALQVLKVIEPDVQPSDLCTRREYARWLVSASSALSRSTVSKVYPAMYIDNVTELAFDDVIPEDPDFSSIQGLAEAGLIESRLSRRDIQLSAEEDDSPFYFSPESPLSRQDLVSWKMALEKRQLPEANRKVLYQVSGFIDTDKIHPNACPALVADLSSGEQGIIALAFGYTRLFQPDKPVTKAQAAMALATGDASEIVSEELARIEAESVAENAVAAHSALVAQVEKDINASFEQELFIEREKISAVERMAEEARLELERLRAEREEDNLALTKERAAIDSEMEVFSKLRHEVEDQLQSLMNDRVEIAHEKERISKLREQAEVENKEICRLQYELEVERKALSMARAWAEDEAKRVREQAIALEEARDRWERHGIKVVVDDDLRKEASAGVTWLNASEQVSVQGTVDRAESLLDKLKQMAADIRGKSRDTLDKIIHMVSQLISKLREWACKTGKQAEEFGEAAISKVGKSASELQLSALEVGSGIKEGAKRVAGDCREGVEKITQKFTQKFKT
uniref:SLH domain-containing protein n=2 Tax=Glycine max TaxID=3847 RepID=A0A0R0I842_SOYBN